MSGCPGTPWDIGSIVTLSTIGKSHQIKPPSGGFCFWGCAGIFATRTVSEASSAAIQWEPAHERNQLFVRIKRQYVGNVLVGKHDDHRAAGSSYAEQIEDVGSVARSESQRRRCSDLI